MDKAMRCVDWFFWGVVWCGLVAGAAAVAVGYWWALLPTATNAVILAAWPQDEDEDE